jgi:hypothetical protein
MRLAAFLGLDDADGLAVLAGAWARHALLVAALAPTHLVLLNPAAPVPAGQGISVLNVGPGIPLADAVCRGVALDDDHAGADFVAAAVRILRPRGRLLAPASTPMPAGVTELARDGELWVAERNAGPPTLVALRPRTG